MVRQSGIECPGIPDCPAGQGEAFYRQDGVCHRPPVPVALCNPRDRFRKRGLYPGVSVWRRAYRCVYGHDPLANATTGGTEMVAILVQCKMKHYSVAQIMQVLDGAVVVAGMYIFGLRPSMYAIVSVFIASKVMDTILEGMKFSKAAYIITERYEAVSRTIMERLDRGVTGLNAKGMYSGEEKCMLYCVVSKKQIVLLKDIIHQIDRNAFVIVGDVREVLGEGFIEYRE